VKTESDAVAELRLRVRRSEDAEDDEAERACEGMVVMADFLEASPLPFPTPRAVPLTSDGGSSPFA
jgi:hypothetical protein